MEKEGPYTTKADAAIFDHEYWAFLPADPQIMLHKPTQTYYHVSVQPKYVPMVEARKGILPRHFHAFFVRLEDGAGKPPRHMLKKLGQEAIYAFLLNMFPEIVQTHTRH